MFYEHTPEQSDASWDSEAELSDLEDFPQAEIDAQFDDSDGADSDRCRHGQMSDVVTGRRGLFYQHASPRDHGQMSSRAEGEGDGENLQV